MIILLKIGHKGYRWRVRVRRIGPSILNKAREGTKEMGWDPQAKQTDTQKKKKKNPTGQVVSQPINEFGTKKDNRIVKIT